MPSIFVKVGTACRLQPWNGDTFASLAEHVSIGLHTSELPSLKRRDVFLLDQEHGVSYNNFNLSEIVDGSMVECRNHAYATAVEQTSAWLHAGDLQGPVNEEHHEEEIVSVAARTRQMLEGGDVLSIPALLWSLTLALVSCITLAVYAYRQLPVFYTRTPAFNSLFMLLEMCSTVLCVTELVLRVWSRSSFRSLLSQPWMWICGISVIPMILYVVSGKSVNVFEVSAIRLLFVSRLLLANPNTRGGMQACQQTVTQSARLLYMLLFFATLALLINASVLYYLERGDFSLEAQAWIRHRGFECTLVHNTPDAETLTEYEAGIRRLPTARPDAPACVWVGALNETAAEFICPASLPVVTSIPEAMWMTVATLTTTGLGDVVPTSPLGKIFNSAVIYVAVTVLALPMTVISSKFEGNFRRFKVS